MLHGIVIGLITVLLLLPVSAQANAGKQSFQAVMAEFRPLQFRDGDEIRGYAADTVRELITGVNHLGSDLEMDMLPWKRATVLSRRGKNKLFFSIARTPEREMQYHWIGEISPYLVGFVRLRDNDRFRADSISELMASKVITGVQRASNAEALLKRLGYVVGRDFDTYNHYRDGLRMLFAGRLDTMPLTVMFYRNNACRQGLDGDRMETLFHVNELSRPLWLVASKETNASTVQGLQQQYKNMASEGWIRDLQNRYMKDWAQMDCKAAAGL